MDKYEKYRQSKIEARKVLRKKKGENFLKFVEGVNKNTGKDLCMEKDRIIKKQKI